MNRYEYENSKKNRKVKRTLKKSVRGLISRIMITVILFLLTLILVKENKEFKKLLKTRKRISDGKCRGSWF